MWVYALHNQLSGKIYIGQTNDIERRVREHNTKRTDHFTTRFDGSWIVIYKEIVQTRKEALIREKELKSYRGRQFIKTFIPR